MLKIIILKLKTGFEDAGFVTYHYYWNKSISDKFIKGESIGLALLNVSGFKKGKDGLNWIDIDVEVKNPSGTIIVDDKNLLGDSGKIVLENNVARCPIAPFYTHYDVSHLSWLTSFLLYSLYYKFL